MDIKGKFQKGQTINYKSGEHFHSSGDVVDILEQNIEGKQTVVYLVSEGNGGARMTYVKERDILTLLNG